MKLSNSLMAQAIFEISQEQPNQQKKLVDNFLKKIRRAKKLKQLPNILRKINLLENANIVNIVSPFQLSSKNSKELEALAISKLNLSQKPHFIYKIDPNLIGGFKIITSQQELDVSLDSYLTQLKENLWKKI